MSKSKVLIISSIVAAVSTVFIIFGFIALFGFPPRPLRGYTVLVVLFGGISIFFASLMYLPLISSQQKSVKELQMLTKDLSQSERKEFLKLSFIKKHRKKLLLVIVLELALLGIAAYFLHYKHGIGESLTGVASLIIVATGTWFSKKVVRGLKEKRSTFFKKR